jgi:ATP-binding cassette subfamily C protein LapB
VQPEFHFSERAEEVAATAPKHWFWDTIKQFWTVYSEVLIASLLINLFIIALPLFIRAIYDRVIPNYAVTTMWVLVSGLALIFIFDILIKTLRNYFIDVAGKNVDVKLSAIIFEKVLAIKMAERPLSVGAFANSVLSFELFRDFITSTTITTVVDLPFALLFILIIFILAGSLAWVPIIAMPIVFLVGYFLQAPLKELSEESFKHATEKYAALIESVSNVETVKSQCAEGALQQRWEKVIAHSALNGVKLRMYSNTGINLSGLIQQLASVAIIIVGVYQIMNGDLTMGTLIACTILSGRALAPMTQVAAIFTRYHLAMSSLRSLNKIMKLAEDRPHDRSLLAREPLQGNIDFQNVTFRYPGMQVAALNNVSFSIRAGERVGIIGRLGSGKTTIAKLIMGLYHPEKGTILLDNVELRQFDIADLRHQIGYVPQDVVLFYGTIKDNICYGKPHVSDEIIIRAAEVTGVNQFVNNNPEGFALQVGERGARLSGGQRQAIAAARAILLDPQIVIFDEPTNSMDDSSENKFKQNLSSYLAEKTFVLITHKSSMLSLVNRLIIMDNGQVVADGPKEQVLTALREGKIKGSARAPI